MQGQKNPQFTIRSIAPADDLSAFDSGNTKLDGWLKRHARGNERLYGTTHVAVDGTTVVGFVTVSARSVAREDVDSKKGPAEVPALLIGRMAVLVSRQKQGIGQQLLAYAFSKAIQQHLLSGCAAVVVDAKPEAVDFYEKFGFLRMQSQSDEQVRLFIAIETVLAAAEPEAIEIPSEG